MFSGNDNDRRRNLGWILHTARIRFLGCRVPDASETQVAQGDDRLPDSRGGAIVQSRTKWCLPL